MEGRQGQMMAAQRADAVCVWAGGRSREGAVPEVWGLAGKEVQGLLAVTMVSAQSPVPGWHSCV